jgi:hypothetical protein
MDDSQINILGIEEGVYYWEKWNTGILARLQAGTPAFRYF